MEKNKYWDEKIKDSRRYDPIMIEICYIAWPDSIVKVAGKEEDEKHNTDFFVFRNGLPKLRIAERIRDYDWYLRYPDDITFRNSLALNGKPHEGDTEWQKMLLGWGDFYIYAFKTEDGNDLFHIAILDLDKVRTIIWAGGLENCGGSNKALDTGCGFAHYTREELASCIVAEYEDLNEYREQKMRGGEI